MQAPIQKCRRYFGKINCRCDNRRNKYFDNTCQQMKWKGYGIGKKANYVRKNWQSISLSVAFTKPINSGQSLESGAFNPQREETICLMNSENLHMAFTALALQVFLLFSRGGVLHGHGAKPSSSSLSSSYNIPVPLSLQVSTIINVSAVEYYIRSAEMLKKYGQNNFRFRKQQQQWFLDTLRFKIMRLY